MKILFFSPYYYPYVSGLTTYPSKILKHLAKKNKITVLTFPHNEKVARGEEIDGCTVRRLPYLFKISKGFISPQSIYYFLRESLKNDIIILNQPNFEGLLLSIIGRLLGKKIISLFHCKLHLSGNIFAKFINVTVDVAVFLQLAMSTNIIGYTKDYISSIWMMKFFKNKILFSLPPIEKLVSDKKFETQLLKEKGGKIWVGFAGRIAQEKGVEYLIGAMKGMKNAELILAGPYGADVAGENNYYQRIVTLLKQSRVPYRFFGNLRGRQLGTFYKMIDVLVLSSTNQTEAFGMVQAECMMAGTPVIASNLPGVRVPIQLTKMGIIVEPKNSQQISDAIMKIIKNKSTYSSETLHWNAEKIFDIQNVFRFYDKLIG
ncbi:glycosyltransferase [Candidatus Roizmanbacteria bacterium]|nr:glycosyltransferase [Candidatus Roizmanbacteria bacterium]